MTVGRMMSPTHILDDSLTSFVVGGLGFAAALRLFDHELPASLGPLQHEFDAVAERRLLHDFHKRVEIFHGLLIDLVNQHPLAHPAAGGTGGLGTKDPNTVARWMSPAERARPAAGATSICKSRL